MKEGGLGLRLPIFGYINGWELLFQAQERLERQLRRSEIKELIDEQRNAMQSFADILESKASSEIQPKHIYAATGCSLKAGDWISFTIEDEELDDGSGLLELIGRMGRQGTILVPDITHVMSNFNEGRRKATTKIVRSPIAVLTMQIDGDPLIKKLDGFNSNADGVLMWLTNTALSNRITMERHVNGRPGRADA